MQEYSMIKSNFDAVDDNPNAQIHDKIRNNLKELLSLTSGSVKRCMDMMKSIDKLKEKFCELNLAPGHPSHRISAAIAFSNCNEFVKSNKVLSPIKLKRKGKPLTKESCLLLKSAQVILSMKQATDKQQCQMEENKKIKLLHFFSPFI